MNESDINYLTMVLDYLFVIFVYLFCAIKTTKSFYVYHWVSVVEAFI